MKVNQDTAQHLFERGDFAALLRQARQNRISDPPDARLRTIFAHVLALAGELVEARRLATLSPHSSYPVDVKAHSSLALGLSAERSGDLNRAVSEFRAAIRFGSDASSPNLVAWGQLHLFRLLIEATPTEVPEMLGEVRRVVSRAANPTITAYMHVCLAALEGQRGRTPQAKRHCDVAESVLELSPNAWITASVLLNRGCLCILEGNLAAAAPFLSEARSLSNRLGLAIAAHRAATNLGHIEMLRGDFERARTTLTRASSLFSGPLLQIGPVEGLARIALATNSLDQCEDYLNSIAAAQSNDELLTSVYQLRWAELTRARLLNKRGALKEALHLLNVLRTAAYAVNDRPLAAAIHVLAARVHSRLGESAAAARELLRVDLDQAGGWDVQCQYWYGASTVVSDEPSLSSVLETRALRRWKQHGVVSIKLEIDDEQTRDVVEAQVDADAAVTTKATMANALAATFDLAHSPRLLGAELLGVIRGLDCSPGARLVESRASAPESSPDQLTLSLGVVDGRRLTLVCPAPERPAAAVLLGDVLRVGRAAQALEQARQEERNRAALWPASPVEEQAGALFLAEEMRTLLATARRLAATNVPVLITGETGTGKEVLARTIHGYSARAARTFLPFNCTATPRDMVDAQLFGHRRGAFTGATEHFPGIIRAAAGGTLLLDEIGEIPLDVQPKLLRFLESGEVHPIGETHPTRVDVRVIAATNADLDTLMAQGRFREDLFYRLNIVRLPIPPLRERRVEIPTLANHYLQKYAAECGKQELRLADETMEYLVLYSWPGNVRRLANEMRRMAALAENGAVLMPEHLSPEIAASRRTIPASQRALEPTEVVVRMDQPLPAATQHLERAMIGYAMARCGGRLEETAALLGLSRKGLYLKRQRLGLEVAADDLEFN